MGAYQTIVKIQEMGNRWESKDFSGALQILDTIDVNKVKNISDLNLFIEIYTENERYQDAIALLERAYKKTKSKKMLHQMVWISIQQNGLKEAKEYLKEYKKVAPKDYYNYIFQYQIDQLSNEPYDVLIDTLVKLKNTEYLEVWAYELAKLYYKAGMAEECISECSDIILWFGEGSYVEKAKILRAYFLGEMDKDQILEYLKNRG